MSKRVQPLVGVVMGSRSDWETMQHAVARLEQLGVPCEVEVVSAHRTPDRLFEYAASAAQRGRSHPLGGLDAEQVQALRQDTRGEIAQREPRAALLVAVGLEDGAALVEAHERRRQTEEGGESS